MKFESFKDVCLNFRAKHDLTQKRLREMLGVSHNMVSRYELGISKPTTANRIRYENKMKKREENKNENVSL